MLSVPSAKLSCGCCHGKNLELYVSHHAFVFSLQLTSEAESESENGIYLLVSP